MLCAYIAYLQVYRISELRHVQLELVFITRAIFILAVLSFTYLWLFLFLSMIIHKKSTWGSILNVHTLKHCIIFKEYLKARYSMDDAMDIVKHLRLVPQTKVKGKSLLSFISYTYKTYTHARVYLLLWYAGIICPNVKCLCKWYTSNKENIVIKELSSPFCGISFIN